MSLALRRALGAAGGAAGALALLPLARDLAAQLVGPARLPGRELATGDVKAAVFAELAVLVLVLPAAAFVFGRVVPDRVRARGGSAVALPGLAFGAAFLAWRLSVSPGASLVIGTVAAVLAATLSAAGPRLFGLRRVVPSEPGAIGATVGEAEAREHGKRTRAAWGLALALAILFAGALRFAWRPHASLDLFESGHMLGAAQAYLAGGAPYRDTYPVHGWGADGGLDAVVFRVLEPTLAVHRGRHAVTAALALVAAALACWALFRRPLWSAAAFVLALSLCPYFSDRQAPAFLALAALIWAAQSGRRRAWCAAGAASAAALFYTLDFGLMLVLASVLTLACTALDARRGWLLRPATALAVGLAAGAAPFLAFFSMSGTADDFFRVSLRELPSRISDIWSVPASPAAPLFAKGASGAVAAALLFGQGVPWLFHAAIYAFAATVLLFRAARGPLSTIDRGAVAAIWVGILAMRGALGRADEGHLMLYGVFAALPATWLLYRAARSAHAPWLWAPLLAFALVVRAQPQRVPILLWYGIAYSGPGPADCHRTTARSGSSTVPCGQSDDLASLRSWMDRELPPGATFFDYGNEPALYFLMDRRPPVRFCCVPFYEGASHEREVIAALERERPPVAILSSGTFLDAFDGVPNRVRTPLVAAYLDRHYEPAGRVGTRTLGRRKPPEKGGS